MLEPGPVKTSIPQNSAAWVGESIDNTTADQKSQEMLKLGLEFVTNNKAVESTEVAVILREIILGNITNFRCQINADFLTEVMNLKLTDPASNEPIDLISKLLYKKHQAT